MARSTPEQAARRGQEALDDYVEAHMPQDGEAAALASLLADLMHLADSKGLDFGYALEDAQKNHRNEGGKC